MNIEKRIEQAKREWENIEYGDRPLIFIGSATCGANGDVTNFIVPGGIQIGFTGQSVRHNDGRQLQRVGLVPHVEVQPTIRGIREGRDEVLEKAIEYPQGRQ